MHQFPITGKEAELNRAVMSSFHLDVHDGTIHFTDIYFSERERERERERESAAIPLNMRSHPVEQI